MRGEAGPARQGERAPGIVTSVESWRFDDAPTCSSMQTAARNLSRWVELILVSVFWRERLSCQSVPWGVEVRSCIVSVVVEERGVVRSCRVARHTPHVQARLQAVCSTSLKADTKQREEALFRQACIQRAVNPPTIFGFDEGTGWPALSG